MKTIRKTAGALFTTIAVALLTACGGGGGGGSATPPSSSTLQTAAPVTPQSITFNAVIIFPNFTDGEVVPSSARHPRFISPSTAGTSLAIFPAGNDTGNPIAVLVANVSTGSPLCTTTGSGRTCTIPITAAAGNYDFILSTFDAAPVGGVIPTTAHQLARSIVTQQIAVNQNNSITFLLSGIVSTVGITTGGGGPLTYASLPADGATHNFAFIVNAMDADGNVITGTVPFTVPVAVTLAETGGAGHTQLILNGAASGTTASIAKATDTIALRYDGGGTPGYTTTTTIGGKPVIVSPLYITPASQTITTLVSSAAHAITEASAPASIAYAGSTNCVNLNSVTVSGSGAAATLNLGSNAPAGTNVSCTATVTDVLGTQLSIPITFAISGPITAGAPSGNASGSCATSIAFAATGLSVTVPLSDPGFAGTISLANSAASVATASITGSTVTVTSQSAGSTVLTFSDPAGNSLTCSIGVTTTNGTVQ